MCWIITHNIATSILSTAWMKRLAPSYFSQFTLLIVEEEHKKADKQQEQLGH